MSFPRPLHLPGYGRPEPNYNNPFGPYGYGQARSRGYLSEQWPDPNQFNANGPPYSGLTPEFSPWDRPAMHGTETSFTEETDPFSPSVGASMHHSLTTSSGVSGDDEVETPSVGSEEPDNASNMAGSG
jgi:hypothetical protein